MQPYPFRHIFLLLSLFIFGTRRPAAAQNIFITGRLSRIADNAYIYLTSYPWTISNIDDSAQVENGVFSFHLTIPDGGGYLYYLSAVRLNYTGNASPPEASLTSPNNMRNYHPVQLIYLEKGKMGVTGNAMRLDETVWTGPAYMNDQQDWFNLLRNNPHWQKAVQSMDYYRKSPPPPGSRPLKESDTIALALLTGMVVRKELAKAWMLRHLDSRYSTVLLFNDIKPFFEDNSTEKVDLFNRLTPGSPE